jgi:hypothetical protein
MENQEDLIVQFINLTGSDSETAQFMLQASNWDLSQASNLFFDQGMGGTSSTNNNQNNFEDVVREPIQETVQRLSDCNLFLFKFPSSNQQQFQ